MLLLIFSFLFFQFSNVYLTIPLKKINRFEGFRSKKAMSSQENWDKAQRLLGHSFKQLASYLIIIGFIIFLVEIFAFFFLKNSMTWLLILETFIFFICCFIIKYSVDSKLE